MRRQILIVLLATATLGGAAHAQNQTHYHCNEVGAFSTCQDSDGDTYTVFRDSSGATVTDSRGRTARVTHDAFGGTTIQGQDGKTVHGHTDSLGNTTYDDGEGHQSHCRRSPIDLPGQSDEDCD
jgi:hypothetical protein